MCTQEEPLIMDPFLVFHQLHYFTTMIFVCICVCVCAYVCMYVYTCIYAYMCDMYVCLFTCVNESACMPLCTCWRQNNPECHSTPSTVSLFHCWVHHEHPGILLILPSTHLMVVAQMCVTMTNVMRGQTQILTFAYVLYPLNHLTSPIDL